jgi:hypothetical protein
MWKEGRRDGEKEGPQGWHFLSLSLRSLFLSILLSLFPIPYSRSSFEDHLAAI